MAGEGGWGVAKMRNKSLRMSAWEARWGGSSLHNLYRYVPPKGYGFHTFRPNKLKMGIKFNNFDLKSENRYG